jgi:site-specific recombinase XerD
MDDYIASAHGMAPGKHVHSSHRLGLGFATEEGSAATLARHGKCAYLLHPAGSTTAGVVKRTGWHAYGHTFSTLIKSLGVDAKVVQELLRHASFKTTMDGYTQLWKHRNAKHRQLWRT